MTRRWQTDPYFEKYVQKFYTAVAIPDRSLRDAEIRRLMADFKKRKIETSTAPNLAPARSKKVSSL